MPARARVAHRTCRQIPLEMRCDRYDPLTFWALLTMQFALTSLVVAIRLVA